MVWSMRLCYPSSLACDSLVFRLVILNFKKEQRFRFIEIIVSGRGVKLIAFLLALFPTSVTYNRIVGKGRWRVSPYNITPESHIRVTKIKKYNHQRKKLLIRIREMLSFELDKEIEKNVFRLVTSEWQRKNSESPEESKLRPSERGIRRSEILFLIGTQNFFFVPRSWQDEKSSWLLNKVSLSRIIFSDKGLKLKTSAL